MSVYSDASMSVVTRAGLGIRGNGGLETRCGKLYHWCVEYFPLASNLTSAVVYAFNAQAFSALLNVIFRTIASGSEGWKNHTWVVLAIQNVKLLAAVSLPFAIYSVMYNGWLVLFGKEKIDAALTAIEGLGWLADSAATFIAGLDVAGVLHNTVTTALSFSLVGVALSTATIALNVRRLWQSHSMKKEIKACTDKAGNEDAAAQLKLLASSKDNYYLDKNFNTGKLGPELTLKDALEKIEYFCEKAVGKQGESKVQETGKQIQQETMNCLRGRIRTKEWSHQLAIVSSVITAIGMLVFLLSPFSVAAYGLLAVAAVISVGSFIYERKCIRTFQTAIENIQNKVIIFCETRVEIHKGKI